MRSSESDEDSEDDEGLEDGNAQRQKEMDNNCDFYQPHSCCRYVMLLQDRVRLNIPIAPWFLGNGRPPQVAHSADTLLHGSLRNRGNLTMLLLLQTSWSSQSHLIAQDVLLAPTRTENKVASGAKGAALDYRGVPGIGRKLRNDHKSTAEALQQDNSTSGASRYVC